MLGNHITHEGNLWPYQTEWDERARSFLEDIYQPIYQVTQSASTYDVMIWILLSGRRTEQTEKGPSGVTIWHSRWIRLHRKKLLGGHTRESASKPFENCVRLGPELGTHHCSSRCHLIVSQVCRLANKRITTRKSSSLDVLQGSRQRLYHLSW